MTPPQPGDRRPREGRCPDCDRPLSDEVYETRVLGGFLALPENAVTDWWEVDHQEGHCAGEPLCDGERVDWEQRARDAEAERDAARGEVADLLAHADAYTLMLTQVGRERDRAFRDGVQHMALAAAWIAPDCRCDVSWTARGLHAGECAAWVRDEIAAWAAEVPRG